MTCTWLVLHRLENWKYNPDLAGRKRLEPCGRPVDQGARCRRHVRPPRPAAMPLFYPYVFHWNRAGRKGDYCRIVVSGKMNSRLIEFEDGTQLVTSGNSLRKRKPVLG